MTSWDDFNRNRKAKAIQTAIANKDPWRMGLWTARNDRVWLVFPFDHRHKDAIKDRVPGAQWSAEERFWHFPLDLDVCRDIAAVAKSLGVGIRVEPELVKWVKEEKERYAHVLSPNATNDDWTQLLPRVKATRPALWEAMREIAVDEDGVQHSPWQLIGAAFLAAQKTVLLADQPGLGKTVQTLAAIAELDVRGPILVTAPRTAINVTWPEEIEKWLSTDETIFIVNATVPAKERRLRIKAAQSMTAQGKRVWVLCGPNYLRIEADVDEDTGNYLRDEKGHKIIRAVRETVPELFGIRWSAVIADESHKTLACATGNIKRQSAQRVGLGALEIIDGGLKIAISGTPFRGKTENLFGTLQWLLPKKYTSYWKWIKRHYGTSANESGYGGEIIKGDRILDEKRFFAELKPIMVRRTKHEVRKSLPPKLYGGSRLDPNDEATPVAVWLPMSTRQEAQYREIEKQALINVGTDDEITINGVLAEIIRCKQVANSCLKPVGFKSDGTPAVTPIFPSNKADWIYDFLAERIENGTKTIVASQFTGFLELLSVELTKKKINHYLFTGKTSDKDRDRIKREFQSETGEMVILLNTDSGGVSLTLDLADDVVIVDQKWIPDDQEQVEDRAHRVSRNHNVVIWNLASLGTIDEHIAVLNNERAEAITSILDKQRGVSYAKALVSKIKAAHEDTAA